MNGFLSPSGELFTCTYRGHGGLAKQLLKCNDSRSDFQAEDDLKEVGYIYIGGFDENIHTKEDSRGFVCMDNYKAKVTNAQIEWFKNNKEKLAKSQKESFAGILLFQTDDDSWLKDCY